MDELPFKIVRMQGSQDQVITRVENLLISKAAFEKALFVYPNEHLEMRQGRTNNLEVQRGRAVRKCEPRINPGLSFWRDERCARVSSLARYEKNNRKAAPQAAFLEIEPRATRPDSWPLPRQRKSSAAAPSLPLGSFALLSRKLGCGACTKSHDTRPKRGRLGSSSMLARRRQERALHRPELGGLSPLQTMYQLPSPQ